MGRYLEVYISREVRVSLEILATHHPGKSRHALIRDLIIESAQNIGPPPAREEEASV